MSKEQVRTVLSQHPRVADTPLDQLLGRDVYNLKTGNFGKITSLNFYDRYGSLDIKWSNGTESLLVFHMWCRHLVILPEANNE